MLKTTLIIQNMARFYVYEMSGYCGWEIPEDGLYECNDLKRYFQEPDRFPFFIKVNEELAGFALINKVGTDNNVDWNMGEFFIIAKFQRTGIGQHVASNLFDQFPGVWEVAAIPENKRAANFWHKIISLYTQGDFTQSLKKVPYPSHNPMIVFRFTSKVT
jgi:predicted acetyltransferase